MIKKRITTSLAGLVCAMVFAGHVSASNWQQESGKITHQEQLRGSITLERMWWDLIHYHLNVKVDPETKLFSGKNIMTYNVLAKGERLQIELQAPMKLEKVHQNGKALEVEQDGYSYFITPASKQ
ncbi:MAG: hypothetical protein ACI971_002224, partial [Colwellia sp.]